MPESKEYDRLDKEQDTLYKQSDTINYCHCVRPFEAHTMDVWPLNTEQAYSKI